MQKIKLKSFAQAKTNTKKSSVLFFSRKQISNLEKFQRIDSFKSYIPIGNNQSYGRISIPNNDGFGIKLSSSKENNLKIDFENNRINVPADLNIFNVQKYLISHQLHFPVVPGAMKATIGGCIAADVHGKNGHKYGSFGDHVEKIELYSFQHNKILTITKKDDLFYQTIGGFGVTGIIISATLNVIKIHSNFFYCSEFPVSSPKELIKLLIENENECDDIGAWFSISNKMFYGKVYAAKWGDCFESSKEPSFFISIVKYMIFTFFKPMLVKLLFHHLLVYLIYRKTIISKKINVMNLMFPLKYNQGWEKFYGCSFVERQFLVPINQSIDFFNQIVHLMAKHNIYTLLSGVKLFRGNRLGLMSFANEGISFSIQYSTKNSKFDHELNKLLVLNGFPEYLAKIQEVSSNFPFGYKNFNTWFNLATENKINSKLLKWLGVLTR